MTAPSSERIHASCVAIGDRAVLLAGASGSGKSDLALRLIDRGAKLVSDDQTLVMRNGQQAVASAPATIRGQIEVRAVGILSLEDVQGVEVALVILLGDQPQRFPEAQTQLVAGVSVPAIALSPFEASAPIKIELALKQLRPPS